MKKNHGISALFSLCRMSLVSEDSEAGPADVRSEILCLEGGGERIEGVFCLPAAQKESYPTVVLAHGFGGNYRFLTGNQARELARHGFAAFAFNFRNPDTRCMLNTSVLTEARTLNIVLDQIGTLPCVDRDRLFLLGESQGGFVSAYVAAKRAEKLGQDDIRGLILFYPAFVLQDDAKKRNPGYREAGYVYPETETVGANVISGTYSEVALSFDIYDVIPSYRRDVLLIHGTEDTVVPLSYSERAVKTYENAELKIIENAGHGFYFGESFALSMQYTTDFLKRRLCGE